MLQALLSEFLITKINKLTQTLGPENKNSKHHSITLDRERNKSSLRRVVFGLISSDICVFLASRFGLMLRQDV